MAPGTKVWPYFQDLCIIYDIFLVSFKENEIITGLRVFLSVKRCRLPWVVADDDDV